MDKRIPVGTLVSPKRSVVEDHRDEYYRYNSGAVANHGWLYFVDMVDERSSEDEDEAYPYIVYECRSLATGKRLRWTNRELEEVPDA